MSPRYRKLYPQKRPVWSDPSSYPPNHEIWSYRRWAWEFLRRNREYQAVAAEQMRPGPPGWMAKVFGEHAEIAKGFGRCDLKCYREEYLVEEDDERHWLAETVSQLGDVIDGDVSERVHQLKPGQFALVFDLTCSLRSGKAAKTSLLNHAMRLFDEQFAKFEESLSVAERPRIVKVRRNKLFHWLRLHDAVEHTNADPEEVRRELYGDPGSWSERDRAQKRLETMKKMSVDLRRAREMVDGGYLELIPLDYLQKRSGRRGS